MGTCRRHLLEQDRVGMGDVLARAKLHLASSDVVVVVVVVVLCSQEFEHPFADLDSQRL